MKKTNISIEKMFYKNDKLSYSLTLVGLLLNVFYFFTLYRNNGNFYYTYEMGISVIYNLLFMLFVFLSAEEVKVYKMPFSFVLMIIGLGQIARIFYYPHKAYINGVLPEKRYETIIIYLVISAFFLIVAGIISLIKSTLLRNYLEKAQGE